MNLKWLNFDKPTLIFILLGLIVATSTKAQDIQQAKIDTIYVVDTVYMNAVVPVGYDKKINRIKSRWEKLVPRYSKAQFAGSMGLISLGTGWDYGKNRQWETDFLIGFVPKYSTDKNKITMTLKQNFIPWTVRLNDNFNLKPFSAGLYVNTIFGGEFWGKEPAKYPNSYYKFSTKLRINIFMGQGWEYKLDTDKKVFCKSITFSYELSTNELYLMSAFTNKYLTAKDVLGLSLGVKLQFL